MSPGEDGLIGIPFPEHSNELLSRLNDQRRAGLLCDLTLTSRGTRYPTHRSVMAAVSLYFRRLFGAEGVGVEGGGSGMGGGFSVCQLDCVAPDALDALLEFAYTATLTIRSSGMREVLRGAQLLGIQCVADACRDILGETVEAEGVSRIEETAHPVDTEGAARAGSKGVMKGSRRKTDRKKVKRVGSAQLPPLSHPSQQQHQAVRELPSPPPSHPSPAHNNLHSHPSTQPPSPEREELHVTPERNGNHKARRRPERGTTLNGGVHWSHERPLIAQCPPAPLSDPKFPEEDEMESSGNDGFVAGATSLSSSLAEHKDMVTGAGAGRKRKSQTPQQCPVCQKIIHGAGKLPRHMRTHTGEKPFQCSACGVRFTRNDKLKIHMRKHTGERPYPCPHCQARFLHSYDLKNHLSLHSGARPFECPLCHKAFAREDHLQRHRKGHSCLELRTRRPRRDVGAAGGRPPSSPLEPLDLQAHSSAFLARAVLAGGDGSGPPLIFQGEVERERSLALQALAHLGAHRLPGYPGLLLQDLDLQRGREAEGEEQGGTGSPAAQHNTWVDEEEEEEEMGDDQEEE